MTIPSDPETLLTGKALAGALTQRGFPISSATLTTRRTRGGGPPFRKFGPRVLYDWGESLEWARSKLSPAVNSTAQLDAARQPERKAAGDSAAERETSPAPRRQAARSQRGKPAADLTGPSAA